MQRLIHLRCLVCIYSVVFILSALHAQAELIPRTEMQTLNAELLDVNLNAVSQYFAAKDSLIINQTFTPEVLNPYEKTKERYLKFVKQVDYLQTLSLDSLHITYTNYLGLASKFDTVYTGNLALQAYNQFEEKFAAGQTLEAVKLYFLARFLKHDQISYRNAEISAFKLQVKHFYEAGEFSSIIPILSKIDSLYLLSPTEDEFTEDIDFRYHKQQALANQTEVAFKKRYVTDIRVERNWALHLGLAVVSNKAILSEFRGDYTGDNPDLSDLIFFYELTQPSNVGQSLALAIDYRVFKQYYLGFDFNLFRYEISRIDPFIIQRHPTNFELNDRGFLFFNDFTISGFSYHSYIHYKFTNETAFHPFFRIGIGRTHFSRSSSQFKPEELDYDFFSHLFERLEKQSESLNELELGIGLEVFKVIGDRLSITPLFIKKFHFEDSDILDRSNNYFGVKIGYYAK